MLLAIPAGLIAGLIHSWIRKQTYEIVDLRYVWLVPIAYLSQLFVFHIPVIARELSRDFVAGILVSSQFILLVFVWMNLKHPGFWLLGIGLGLNFLVIILNGGFMPISPETITRLIPGLSTDLWKTGERFGTGKDIVLAINNTRLWWLSDRFLLPEWIPYRAAFSLGDIFIAVGVFLLLWEPCKREKPE